MSEGFAKQPRGWAERVGIALDVLGVYLLPPFCFALDYAYGGFWWTQLYPLALWTFAAAGMVAFAVSNRAMPSPTAASVAAGALFTSGYGAGLIGLPFIQPGLLGLALFLGTGEPLFAIAVFAFAPFLTAQRLLRRARTLLRAAAGSPGSMGVGASAIILPTGLALLIEITGDQRREADLRSMDRDRVLRALSPDSWYGPRDIIGWSADLSETICRTLSALPLDDADVENAARRALVTNPTSGKTVREYCSGP